MLKKLLLFCPLFFLSLSGFTQVKTLKNFIVLVVCLFTSGILWSQKTSKKGAFDEQIMTEEQKLEQEINKYAPNKKRPANSTDRSTHSTPDVEPGAGRMTFQKKKVYTIRVLITPDPLDMTNAVFRVLPDDKVEFKQVKGVGYIYMIGAYTSHSEAMEKLRQVNQTFPKAKLITDREHPHID